MAATREKWLKIEKATRLELDCFSFAFIREANELARSFPSLGSFLFRSRLHSAVAAAGGAAQRSPTRREMLENQPEKIPGALDINEEGRSGGTPCDFPAGNNAARVKRESLADSAAIRDNVFVREERRRRKSMRQRLRSSNHVTVISLQSTATTTLFFYRRRIPPLPAINEPRSQVLSLVN